MTRHQCNVKAWASLDMVEFVACAGNDVQMRGTIGRLERTTEAG